MKPPKLEGVFFCVRCRDWRPDAVMSEAGGKSTRRCNACFLREGEKIEHLRPPASLKTKSGKRRYEKFFSEFARTSGG